MCVGSRDCSCWQAERCCPGLGKRLAVGHVCGPSSLGFSCACEPRHRLCAWFVLCLGVHLAVEAAASPAESRCVHKGSGTVVPVYLPQASCA